MTDRHMGYVVTLDENIREDDSEHVLNALRMVRGVASVTPVTADYEADVIAARRRDDQWHSELMDLIQRIREGRVAARRKDA
jgi:hypothetical protein